MSGGTRVIPRSVSVVSAIALAVLLGWSAAALAEPKEEYVNA
jgi:hypothetical protein